MAGGLSFAMAASVVEDVECSRAGGGMKFFLCSSGMEPVGEPGMGGETESDDLGVLRPDSEKALNLRPVLRLSSTDVDTSIGPSRPGLASIFSVLWTSFGGGFTLSIGLWWEAARWSLSRTNDLARWPKRGFSSSPVAPGLR